MSGDDKETSRHIMVGNYLLTAAYSDCCQEDSARGETSFTAIEIQLAKKD